MGLMRAVFGRARCYQALSYIYDQYWLQRLSMPRPKDLRNCGPNTVLHPRVFVTHPSLVCIGDWTTIYEETYLHSEGGLHIGDYVGIGCRVTILTFDHHYRNAEAVPFDNKIFRRPVIIRDFAWIGWNSCILPGVEIGEGAIVGMGSVVTKNVPPLAIVLGNPAEVIGQRSREHYERCRNEGKVMPHRIDAIAVEYAIPMMTRRRYGAELRDLGLWDEG
jgi:acetyltransferase-like isoleucine patch superfamily enzyme